MRSLAVPSSSASKSKGKGKASQSSLGVVTKKLEPFPSSWLSEEAPSEIAIHNFNIQNGLTPANSKQWALKSGEHAVTRLRQTILSTSEFKSEVFNPRDLTNIALRLKELFNAAVPAVRKVFQVQDTLTDIGQILMNHAAFLDAWDESVHETHSLHNYSAYGLVPSLPGQKFGQRSAPRSMLPNIISSIIFIDRIFFTESLWPNKDKYFDDIFAESTHYSTNVDELRRCSSPIYYDAMNMAANNTSAPFICWETLAWREKIEAIVTKRTKGDARSSESMVGFSDYAHRFIALAEVANQKSVQGACEGSIQRAAWGFVTVYGLTPVRIDTVISGCQSCMLTSGLFAKNRVKSNLAKLPASIHSRV